MKIFCKFLTVNISQLHFWLVICIAKNFIWTTLKAIFSIFRFFFAPSDSRFSNSCISAKYCPILTNHISMESLFINLNFEKFTLKTCFVVQGHNYTACHSSQFDIALQGLKSKIKILKSSFWNTWHTSSLLVNWRLYLPVEFLLGLLC